MRETEQPVPLLSKSKYLAGLQCAKLLWYHYNAKEKIPAPDEATEAIFEQGHLVGELAKSLFPGGMEVAKGTVDFARVLPESLDAVKLRKPLFEAAFRYKNAFARADILNPVARDEWDIIEVKSSTSVKDINLHDLALQRYTYEGAGLKIRHCRLLYIDNEYVKRGPIDPEKLFAREDVSRRVAELLPGVEGNLTKMVEVILLKKHPDIKIGPHCSDPYDCPLHGLCWDFLPEDNVFTLYRLGQKGFDLLKMGIETIVEIPDDYRLSDAQGIQMESLKSGRPFIDKSALRRFLTSLSYPLCFLDFETFATAIPLFDDVHPYQQIPFQYSLHIIPSEGARPEHHAYLADGNDDPRIEILRQLETLLGDRGSIMAYHAGFEKGVLQKSTEAYGRYVPWYEKIEPRVVDLLQPFRSFHYYHPEQKGSASIKSVLPALTGKGYEDLEIADGGAAAREYLRVTFGTVSGSEKQEVRRQLLDYCGLDTLGMTSIVAALRKLT